ncbi:hypothetical protein [Caulobacter phage KcrB]|nr:hypothetical protein RW_GP015 [Caulobacter phage RW]WCA46319.1 hypothetical protein [Caulobacter phage KcrB]WCD56254.1 hypothetical protein [Caulobacter phage RLK]WNV48046.1 hypothetical protein GB2A_gp014 [Caulobacter phage GB2A]
MARDTLNICADRFRRAAMLASDDPGKPPALHGVRVETCRDGGVILVATNGAGLVAIRDPLGYSSFGDVTLTIDRATLKACKPSRATGKHPRLVIRDRRVVVLNSAGDVLHTQAAFPTLEAQAYPDWRRCLPRGAAGPDAKPCDATFNPRVLTKLADALADPLHRREETVWVELFSTNEDGAPALAIGALLDAFGVAMPLRAGYRAAMFPSWAGQG